MADVIPREFIELLLAKIDLVDLINLQVPLRKKSGSNYFGRCPFHQEKSASFSVSQPKQFYYCFGCGAHGNAIDFLMQHERLSFPEAIENLARQAGMEIPRTASGQGGKKPESIKALYELMTEVATYYYEELRQSQRAIQYLKNRGISGQIAKTFQLGFALNGFHHVLDAFGKTETDKKKLLECGLIIKKDDGGYYDRFRDRVMFPIHDYQGRIIGFGGRILDQGEPKYLNSPETPLFQKGHELYGLYQAIKAHRNLDRIIIVEGYMDVIALFQQGITYAVATLGTATSHHHLTRLFRYTSEIIFCFDGDEAGRNAAWRALLVLLPLMQDSLQIRFLFLPDGEDPDSLVRKEGKALFEQRLQSASSLSAFFFQTLSKQCDMNALEGRAKFAASALNLIKLLPQGMFQTMLLDELGKRARVDVHTLKGQIDKREHADTIVDITPPMLRESDIKLSPPMRLALALLIQNPKLAAHLTAPLPACELPGYAFFVRLVELIQTHAIASTAALHEYFRDQKEEAFVTKLAISEQEQIIPDMGLAKEFVGAIKQVIALGQDMAINRLLEKAAQEGLSEGEKIELTHFIAKKKALLPAGDLHLTPAPGDKNVK